MMMKTLCRWISISHNHMIAWGRVEGWLHAFSALTLDGGVCSALLLVA